MPDITVNIDLSDPDGVERGTEQMRYLVGVNLTQSYLDDPRTLPDHPQNVVSPAYTELAVPGTTFRNGIRWRCTRFRLRLPT